MHRIVLLFFMVILSGCNEVSTGAPEVSRLQGNLLLTVSHGDGVAWGLADCSACHAMQRIHEGAQNIRAIVARKGYGSCTGCHGDNGSGATRSCLICHNQEDLPASPHQSGIHRHDFNIADADQQCQVCHVGSDMDGKFEESVDLTGFADEFGRLSPYLNVAGFCLRCHNRQHQQQGYEFTPEHDPALMDIADAYGHLDKHGYVDGSGERTFRGLRPPFEYGSVVACTACHAVHGTDNESLIIDDSRKAGISRPDGQGYSVSIFEENYAQLCVLCHQMRVEADDAKLDTGNGLSGVHQVNGECRSCHSHGEAVQAGL